MEIASKHPRISNNRWVAPVVSGTLCFVGLVLAYGAWVHFYFGGMPHATFLPSTMWGTTEAERVAGWGPIFQRPDAGWDGQFYFRQSTDPFLNTDSIHCSDNVSYRYQRIGIPLLSWSLAKCLGQYPTTGWLFQGVQFALVGMGFGVLIYWLQEQRLSPIYALAWLLCGGFFALFHGLPDESADGIFIVCCICLIKQRWMGYTLSASLLLLCREGYAVFAAAVFVLTVCRWLKWKEHSIWKTGLATAMPGVVLVSWSCYVAYRLGTRPMSGAGELPFGFLVDWPYLAYFRTMYVQFPDGSTKELMLKSLCIVTIFSVFILLVRNARKWRPAMVFLPYVGLISMTGTTIWETVGGYPKATSAILVIALLMLPHAGRRVVPALLLLHILFGAEMAYRHNVRNQSYMHQDILAARDSLHANIESPPRFKLNSNQSSPSMKYDLSIRRVGPRRALYGGIFQRFHRWPLVMEATIINRSDATWNAQSSDSDNSLAVGWQHISGKGQMQMFQKANLDRDVAPGEAFRCLIWIPCSNDFQDDTVLIGLYQASGRFFLEEQGGSPVRIKLGDIE